VAEGIRPSVQLPRSGHLKGFCAQGRRGVYPGHLSRLHRGRARSSERVRRTRWRFSIFQPLEIGNSRLRDCLEFVAPVHPSIE